jgi:Protein of unknown function (DUF664)
MTPRHILVRVATDTSPHAGQADIIRELIYGTAGRTGESALTVHDCARLRVLMRPPRRSPMRKGSHSLVRAAG